MLLKLLLLFIHLQDKLLKRISNLLKSNMSIVTLSQVVYTLVIDHGIHKFKAISCKHHQYQITSVSNVYCIREKRVKRNRMEWSEDGWSSCRRKISALLSLGAIQDSPSVLYFNRPQNEVRRIQTNVHEAPLHLTLEKILLWTNYTAGFFIKSRKRTNVLRVCQCMFFQRKEWDEWKMNREYYVLFMYTQNIKSTDGCRVKMKWVNLMHIHKFFNPGSFWTGCMWMKCACKRM